jgi:hypothetical protein
MSSSENNETGFRIRIVSDLDYEEMVADICWGYDTVAKVSREKGVENMEIEIFPPLPGKSSWKFPTNDFLDAIHLAKNSLEK